MVKSLVVGIFVLLRFLLLLGRNNLQKYAIICPVTEILRKKTTAWKCLKNWLKYGISWQIKEGKYNDKSSFHLPRQDFNTTPQPLILQGVLSSRDDFTKVLLKNKNVGISSTNLEVNKKSRTLLIVNYN